MSVDQYKYFTMSLPQPDNKSERVEKVRIYTGAAAGGNKTTRWLHQRDAEYK